MTDEALTHILLSVLLPKGLLILTDCTELNSKSLNFVINVSLVNIYKQKKSFVPFPLRYRSTRCKEL